MLPMNRLPLFAFLMLAAAAVVVTVLLILPRPAPQPPAASSRAATEAAQRERPSRPSPIGEAPLATATPSAPATGAADDPATATTHLEDGATTTTIDIPDIATATTAELERLRERLSRSLGDLPPGLEGEELRREIERLAAESALLGEVDAELATRLAVEDPETREDDEPPATGGHRVSGRVLRGEIPVVEATLRLVPEGEGRALLTRTIGDGSYYFAGVSEGVWILVLADPPAPSNTRRLLLEGGANRAGEDFLLPDLPSVRGQVLDLDTGARIPRAQLEVHRGNRIVATARADGEGAFQLPPLDRGGYLLRGRAEGYSPGEQPFTVEPIGESAPVFLRLEGGAVVDVLVVGPSGPVSGARGALFGGAVFGDAYAAQGSRVTGGDGRFQIPLPPGTGAGPYRAGAWAPGLVPSYSDTMPAGIAPEGGPLLIQLTAGTILSGRVVDGEGEPLDGAEVAVREGFPTTSGLFDRLAIPYPTVRSDGAGRFEVRGLEPGMTRVFFSLATYNRREISRVLAAGPLDLGDVVLESEETAGPGRISGLVVDESGRGMGGHGVHIRHVGSGSSWHTTTSSGGQFSFEGVEEGDYILFTNGSTLRGDHFMTMDQTYPFVSSGGEAVYLVYDLGQALRFRVVDGAGNPVRKFSAGVITRYEGILGNGGRRESFGMSSQREFQTTDGRAVLDHLMAGRMEQLTIRSEGATVTLGGRNIPVGGVFDLGDIVLDDGGEAEGIVIAGESGQTLEGVRVGAHAPPGAPVSHPLAGLPVMGTTDGGGRFRLRGIPAGEARLTFERGGRVSQHRDVTIRGGETRQVGEVILVGASSLRGMVTGGDGTPIRQARVVAAGILLHTDSEGRFFSDALPSGPLDLEISHPSWHGATVSVELEPGNQNHIEIQLRRKEG